MTAGRAAVSWAGVITPAVYVRILRMPPAAQRCAAVFLDRDGVIVEDTGYLHHPRELRYIPGAFEAIADLNGLGIPVVLVTNQAGIGRGLYGWSDFELVQQRIMRDLARVGGWLDGVWACAAHPSGVNNLKHPSHPYRKPNPGMLRDAAERMGLDLGKSWIVGDKPLDIEAGCRAGLRGAIQVATGYGSEHRVGPRPVSRTEIFHYESLREAVASIKGKLI